MATMATGRTKRFRQHLSIWQELMHAMAAHQQTGVHLANLHRKLFEEENDEDIQPSTPKPSSDDRLSKRPTQYHPAITGEVLKDAFMDRMRRFWKDAKTSDDKDKVRELVKTGLRTM